LFRKADQPFDLDNETKASVLALVNVSNSKTMGAGIGIFDAGCNVPWTVTYDEVLFIHEGNFKLRVGENVYNAGPGDTLWIPADTPLVYDAPERVTFFYAVSPVSKSPSTSVAASYPDATPDKT
jgi:ethanolamine utilization protein EutQ